MTENKLLIVGEKYYFDSITMRQVLPNGKLGPDLIYDDNVDEEWTETKKVRVLQMIADDMKSDVENFEGKPFNGKNVAEYFGGHGAAIATLAKIVKSMLDGKEVK